MEIPADYKPTLYCSMREGVYYLTDENGEERGRYKDGMTVLEFLAWQTEHANALEKENALLRVACGVADGETVVSAEHGSVLVDGSGGSRKRISPWLGKNQ